MPTERLSSDMGTPHGRVLELHGTKTISKQTIPRWGKTIQANYASSYALDVYSYFDLSRASRSNGKLILPVFFQNVAFLTPLLLCRFFERIECFHCSNVKHAVSGHRSAGCRAV